MAPESTAVCIVCGNQTQEGIGAWHFACRACKYESSRLISSINEKQTHAYVNEDDREKALKAIRVQNFRAIVDIAETLAPANANTLLDVGSAHGWFLEEARAKFEVLGLEPDAVVGELAAKKGLPVRRGFFPEALTAAERFDIIVFNDVIEHIPDIGSALKACHDRINHGGLLVLNLPSSRGIFYRISKMFARCGCAGPFARMWQQGMPSPHVHYFSPRNLNTLVTRFGFVRVYDGELPSVSGSGLLQRLRYAGKVNPIALYAQYMAILCVLPVLRLFSSDIIVCVFRKNETASSTQLG